MKLPKIQFFQNFRVFVYLSLSHTAVDFGISGAFEAGPRGLRVVWDPLAEFCSIEHLENVPTAVFLGIERAQRPSRHENEIAKNRFFLNFANFHHFSYTATVGAQPDWISWGFGPK